MTYAFALRSNYYSRINYNAVIMIIKILFHFEYNVTLYWNAIKRKRSIFSPVQCNKRKFDPRPFVFIIISPKQFVPSTH